jgi:hypothetical protein
MKPVVLFLIFLLISTSSLAASSTDNANEELRQKYQKIFYPDGTPTKEDPYNKKETKTTFQLLNSIKVPDTNIEAVLYSEDLVGTYEFYPEIHLAILQYHEGKTPQINRNMDITDVAGKEYARDLGFTELRGNLNIYKMSNSNQMLHLSLGGTVPGSGGLWSTSNILYLIDKKNYDLHPVFISSNDSGGGMAGWCCDSYYQTYIYLADLDSDGITEIVTQEYNFEIDRQKHKRVNSLSPKLDVFKYDEKDNKYKLWRQTTTLPPDAVELKRVYDIPVHVNSEEDWKN